ncbi:unnamed protein product, partial [Symbiodinium natans]
MSDDSSQTTVVGYEQCFRCTRDATLRWRCRSCDRGGPYALCQLCWHSACPHCGRRPGWGDVWTISDLPSDLTSMTDTMSAVSGESFRAELQRSALAARQAWTRQLEPMLSRIHESCLEAANVGLESI